MRKKVIYLLLLRMSSALTPNLKRTVKMSARELGAMESLFLPRRSNMESCTLPSTKHICIAIRDGQISDTELLKGATEAVRRNALLRARVTGDGAPAARGPSPLSEAGILKNVLAPFGDANMRLGDSPNPLKFEIMDQSAIKVAESAMEPSLEVDDGFDDAWRQAFVAALCGGSSEHLFDDADLKKFEFDVKTGPLWRFKAIRTRDKTAIILGLDHAISDQTSLMNVLEQFGDHTSKKSELADTIPASLESAVLDDQGGRSNGFQLNENGEWPFLALDKGSLNYLVSKVWSERSCVSPLTGSHTKDTPSAEDRRTFATFRRLSSEDMARLRSEARTENTTVGAALAAVAAQCFAERGNLEPGSKLKVLQSLDMRRFQKEPDDSDQLSCRAGSMDLVLDGREALWPLAREAARQLQDFIDRGFGVDCVRVFDWGVDAMEMTRLVQLEADNPLSKGRAYATGVSNAGVYTSDHWKEVYYATSTAFAGSAIQAYVITLKDQSTCLCFSAVQGVVDSADELALFADNFVSKLTEAVHLLPAAQKNKKENSLLTNGVLCASLGLLVGALPHLDAWSAFFSTLSRAYDGVGGRVGELVAPIGFWLFFAVMHPLVGGAGVGLGELTWQFPGYVTGELDAVGPPIAFTVLSILVTNLALSARPARAALAAVAAFWFSATVTAGVAGTTKDIGSYNLALDDAPYPVAPSNPRGCPTFDQVASPQMKKMNFDVNKYQGTWYEHAYHDWTQFSEVYDTSLEISLAEDQRTWVDIFKVKGPSPTKAPKSWRGSPVAMGAAYPLYGDLPDPKIPIINELGFGNYFPNFVIDLQTDPVSGEYSEAIQFQCLEAGGVRVFEGINFLSRKSQIAPNDLDAMFDRAKSIAPYGATRDQMHLVEHTDNFQPIQNWWQDAWAFIGVDKLLALIAADL